MDSEDSADLFTVTPSPSRTVEQIMATMTPMFNQQQNHSFFSSRYWWQAWLYSLPSTPQLYLIHQQETLVGACFISFTHERRGCAGYRRAWLNQSGVGAHDQAWIEYNRIICTPGTELPCKRALLRFLQKYHDCAELYISMTTEAVQWSRLSKWLWLIDEQKIPSYKTLLTDSTDINKLLANMSANTRSQLKRTLKKTQATFGNYRLEVAKQQAQVDYFEQLGSFHRLQWSGSSEGSGFDNPIFMRHHQWLLEHAPSHVRLLRVMAGNTVLGYGYYFLWQSCAYFYCSGVNHSLGNNHIKPGLILHLHAMQYFAEQGYTWYDFLGGESQYKRSLSTHTYEHQHLSLCMPTWRGIALALYRTCRQRIFNPSPLPPAPGSPPQ